MSNLNEVEYKFGGTVYNGVPVGYSINPNMVISAFANEMDLDKVEKYTEIMKEQMLSHDFPPIMGYPIIISEDDLGKNFINGEEITEDFIGQRAWVVTDGHHRVFAALEVGLPMLEVQLDYSTVTNMDEYFKDGGTIIRKPNLIPDPIFKNKQRLKLKGYGEVIIVDSAFLQPPLSPFNDYMYTLKLVYDRKKELSFYEYELEMMLEDYDTGIDYEKSYKKYLSAGVSVIGNPPLSYNKFIEKINKSLYYSQNHELELSEKFTNFLNKYAIYTYSTGGQLQETKMKKTYSDRATLQEVKEKSEKVSMRVNEIKTQLRWHEGKSVAYPITENEKKIIQDGLPELRKERERLYKIYSDMKDKKQSTISGSSVSIKVFDVKFSYAVRLLNNKYIINYSELNKTQKVDNQYYSSYDLLGIEREIKNQTDLLAEKTGDYTDFIELMKLKTDKTEKALNQPQVLLQFEDEKNNLLIVSLLDYLGAIEDKYSDFKVIYSTVKFEVPKKKKVTDVDLEPIEIQAIKDVLTLGEYSRLTQEEAEYVYSKFKNYESLVDEYGEYVAEAKEPYGDKKIEEFKDLMETLYKKGVLMHDSYNETIEAYQNTINLVNSVRGRIVTLSAKKSGTDLFPEADSVNQSENQEIESIKGAIEYLQTEYDAGDEDSGFALDYLKDELRDAVSQSATYASGGEIKYFEIHKGDKPVLKVKFKKDKDESSKDRTIEMLDKLSDRGYNFKEVSEDEYKKFDYSKVDNNDVVEFMSNSEHFEKGGKIKFNKKKVPSSRIYNYALKIKTKYPKIWHKGGEIFGNQAFKNLEKVIKRGYWLESERWMFIKWQSYVARHHKDYRIEGTIAMLKWLGVVDKGWDYMKDLIEEEIKKESNNG